MCQTLSSRGEMGAGLALELEPVLTPEFYSKFLMVL